MSLSRRLLLASLLLIAALVAAIVLIAGGRLRRHLNDELTDRLDHEATLLALEWMPGRDASALARRAGQALGHRVTIIDSTGVVLGDSEFDDQERARLENHAQRPEIVDARAGGRGTARRHSQSAGDEEVYVAHRHPLGFVRVSLTTRSLDEIVVRAQRDVLVSGLLAMLGAVAFAAIFSRSVTRPVAELRDVTRSIAEGDLTRRPSLASAGEVGDLALAVTQMADQLGTRLDALEAEELLMHAVLESLDEGLMALDAAGRVVQINGRARAILRVHQPVPFELPDDELHEVVSDATASALRGESADPRDFSLRGRTVSIASRPLSTGGAVITLQELTALRRLETVRRDFVANVSHELKTPLTVVSGYAETLLDEGIAPDDRRRFVQAIRTNASRMQQIVDDLLDLSRIESGGWRPELANVDVPSLVTDIVMACSVDASRKALELRADLSSPVGTLRADPTALQQVLRNLVENAIRYTSDGTIIIKAERIASGPAVRFTVSDTGIGIPEEHLPRIFERFYRVDAGRSRDVGGTGLGLSIVKHLVEAHNGDASARSEAGRGTTVTVVFPGTPV